MAFRHIFSVGFIARQKQGQAENITWRQVGGIKAAAKTAKKAAKKKGKA